MKKFKQILVISIATTFLALGSPNAEAFSFKRILNPFKVGVSSVLHPFHIVYKINRATGGNPVSFIPGDSLVHSERRWVIDPKTNDWRKYSWELDDQTPPPLFTPTVPEIPEPVRPPITPVPPPVVDVTPPCKRGGPGITPC